MPSAVTAAQADAQESARGRGISRSKLVRSAVLIRAREAFQLRRLFGQQGGRISGIGIESGASRNRPEMFAKSTRRFQTLAAETVRSSKSPCYSPDEKSCSVAEKQPFRSRVPIQSSRDTRSGPNAGATFPGCQRDVHSTSSGGMGGLPVVPARKSRKQVLLAPSAPHRPTPTLLLKPKVSSRAACRFSVHNLFRFSFAHTKPLSRETPDSPYPAALS